jgi:DNA polymerase phi
LREPRRFFSTNSYRDAADIEKEGELRRQILADHLLNIIRTCANTAKGSQAANPVWIKDTALPALVAYAYVAEPRCQPPVSEKTRELYRNRLMSTFGHLLSDLEGYRFPCDILLSISPDAVNMDDGISEAREGALATMKKILKKIKKEEGQAKPPLQALALLYSLVIFQLYNGESEAVSIIDELKLCYDKLIRHKDTDDSDTDASEILVELLLSFISKPSALLRKVSQHAFSAFMSDMTAGGLKLMTDILHSDESLRGQQELFDQEPENFDEMDEGGEDDEMDSDVEITDMNGDEGHLNGHLDEDEESGADENGDKDEEEDEEEEEDDDDEEAKKLDDALAQALGTHRLDKDADADSDSDADMTDSEMMALDSKLVEIFSQRKKEPNKKQEQKDAKETMVNFKNRVLDLLTIFAKKQASNPLAFGLILPILQLIRTTKTKALADKAHGIITSFAKALKSMKQEDNAVIKTSNQIKLLKAIHIEASKDPSHAFARAASTSSLLVASGLVRGDKNTMKKIAKVYHETQDAWMEGEMEKMQIVFFSDFLNWCQSHAKSAQA